MAITGQLTLIQDRDNQRALALGQGDLDRIIDSLRDCGWASLANSIVRTIEDLTGGERT